MVSMVQMYYLLTEEGNQVCTPQTIKKEPKQPDGDPPPIATPARAASASGVMPKTPKPTSQAREEKQEQGGVIITRAILGKGAMQRRAMQRVQRLQNQVTYFIDPTSGGQESPAQHTTRLAVFKLITLSLQEFPNVVRAAQHGNILQLLVGVYEADVRRPEQRQRRVCQQIYTFQRENDESPTQFLNRWLTLVAQNGEADHELQVCETMLQECFMEAVGQQDSWAKASLGMWHARDEGASLVDLYSQFTIHSPSTLEPKLQANLGTKNDKPTGNSSQRKSGRRCYSHTEGQCFYPEDCKFAHCKL